MMNRLRMGTRLALAISFFLTFALVTMAYLGNRYFQDHFSRTLLTQQQILVNALAEEIESKVQIFQDELVAAAKLLPRTLLADPRQAHRWLQTRHAALPIFDNGLFLIDRSGRIVAATQVLHALSGTDFPAREALHSALQTGRPTLSEPLTLPDADHPALFFTAPIFSAQGTPIGLLVGTLNLLQKNFLGRLGSTLLGEKGHLHLLSAQHNIIVKPDNPAMESQLSSYLVPGPKHRMLHGTPHPRSTEVGEHILTAGGKRYLLSRAILDQTGWHLITMFPADELFAPVRKAGYFFLAVLLLLAGISAVLAWGGGLILTRSLRNFTAHVSGFLGSGKLPTPARITSGDEVGILCRVFNKLVAEIELERHELAEAKNFAEQILRDSPSPRLVLDPRGRVISWNRAMERLTGVPAEQMLGTEDIYKPFYPKPRPVLADFVLTDDPDQLKQFYPAVEPVADVPGGLRSEGFFRSANGRETHLLISAVPIRNRDGTLMAAVESLEDITAVKKLAEQEHRYRLLMETVAQAILEYLGSGDINRLATTLVARQMKLVGACYGLLFDYEPNGAIRILAVSRRGDADAERLSLDRRMQQAIAEQGFYRVACNDGLLFTALSKGETLVVNQPGSCFLGIEPVPERSLPIDSFLGVPLKIGEQTFGGICLFNRAEGFAAEQRLEVEAFGQMAALALQSARTEEAHKQTEERLNVVQKFEALGQLCGGVAHDFNNLLTIINGHGGLLARQLPQKSAERKKLELILQAGQRAAALTRQLLAFSRQQVLETRVLELNSLVGDFEKLLHHLLPKNIQLVFNFSEQPVRILADPGQVEQILMNLVVNARDAIDEQPGRITLSMEEVRIDAEFSGTHPGAAAGHYGRIAVEDTGCGMAPEALQKIFDPFFTTKELGRGTGLGLSTVYGIVKQSGGYVDVQSAPETGSRFSVYLPAAKELQSSTAAGRLRPANQAETILVVDDEKPILEIAAVTLREQGYRVLTAVDAEEARLRWQQNSGRIDLLLTDVRLPGEPGVELARQLRSKRTDLNVLYISGYGELHEQARTAFDRTAGFLQKPFTPETLLQAVRQTLAAGDRSHEQTLPREAAHPG